MHRTSWSLSLSGYKTSTVFCPSLKHSYVNNTDIKTHHLQFTSCIIHVMCFGWWCNSSDSDNDKHTEKTRDCRCYCRDCRLNASCKVKLKLKKKKSGCHCQIRFGIGGKNNSYNWQNRLHVYKACAACRLTKFFLIMTVIFLTLRLGNW